MSSEFVRYTPEIEKIDPHLDELMAQIIDFWEKKGRESPKTEGTASRPRGAREVIRLGQGRSRDTGRCTGGVCAGHLRQTRQPRHLIRFSRTSGHLGTDAQLGPGLGFAIKIFDVDGPKTCRRRARLEHIRPRTQEQSDLHRQYQRSTTCSSRRSPTISAIT
jgi:hypothetical protein